MLIKTIGANKMILSQTINCILKFGSVNAVKMIADAGFDAIDYEMRDAFNNKNIVSDDERRSYAKMLLQEAKRNNVYFNQAHALTYIPADDPEESHRLLREANKTVIEIASLMEIGMLVVHPVSFGGYIGNEKYVFERNMEYFKELLPYAEKYGVKLACENMWCGDKRKKVTTGSTCSNPYEHAYYVDAMNSEMFVACLDVGHSSLAGREAQDCIRVLGDRLQALHIHDNDYLDDMHTLPGLSEMNWDEITKALADINYKGDFTFETDHFFDSFNTVEEAKTGMKLAELIGRKMIRKIESCK